MRYILLLYLESLPKLRWITLTNTVFWAHRAKTVSPTKDSSSSVWKRVSSPLTRSYSQHIWIISVHMLVGTVRVWWNLQFPRQTEFGSFWNDSRYKAWVGLHTGAQQSQTLAILPFRSHAAALSPLHRNDFFPSVSSQLCLDNCKRDSWLWVVLTQRFQPYLRMTIL